MARGADKPLVIPANLNALTFLTTPNASLEHIVSTTCQLLHPPFLQIGIDIRCPVVGFNLRISSFVDPLTAMISCPFVPENEPTAAREILVGGDRVILSKCILHCSQGTAERFSKESEPILST